MGRGGKIEVEEEPKPKNKIEKVGRAKLIKKRDVRVNTKRNSGMELETAKSKFDKKYNAMMARKKAANVSKPKFVQPTPRPEYAPDTFKNFEKEYDTSVTTKSVVVPGMSKGQKKRTLKKEKLEKKKLFQQYLENLKNKKSGKKAFTLGDIGQSLEGVEFDLGVSLKKEEEDKHKGVSSKAKHNIGNEEILRTQKILQHQAFLSNPLGIIKQHIVNSINLKEAQEAKKTEDNKKKPSKKKEGMQFE